MSAIRIAVGGDHGGFELKDRLMDGLFREGCQVADLGTYSADPCNYPVFAMRVSHAVANKAADYGIIICRSGNGVAMVANRIPGIRAAIAHDAVLAKLAREHNGANVLVLGADHLAADPMDIVRAWLNATPEGGRHARRLAMIDRLDKLRASDTPMARMILAGQGFWLEQLDDSLISTDLLRGLVEEYGIRGVVPNNQLLQRMIEEKRGAYARLLALAKASAASSAATREEILAADATHAADLMRPLYSDSAGDEGYVCVATPVAAANDETALYDAAKKLQARIDRPNLMVAVPATAAGSGALKRLVIDGIHVNISGICSREQYKRAAKAYHEGVIARMEQAKPAHAVRSVATVHLGAIQAAAQEAAARLSASGSDTERAVMERAAGEAGLAVARLVYQDYWAQFFGAEFSSLAGVGAQVQQLAFSSPGSVHAIESLVGPSSLWVLNPEMCEALRTRAHIHSDAFADSLSPAQEIVGALSRAGMDFAALGEAAQARWLQSEGADELAVLSSLDRALA